MEGDEEKKIKPLVYSVGEEKVNSIVGIADPANTDEVIICIDTRFLMGDDENSGYYNYVNNVVSDVMTKYEKVRIIPWSTKADFCFIDELDSDGYTEPVTFLRLLKNIDTKYHLIVTTNGEINGAEFNACNNVLNNSNILANILSLKIYFIGDINDMDLQLSDLFVNIKDKIIIVNDQEPIKIFNVDVETLTYDDFVNNDNIIGSVLELIRIQPDLKKEFHVRLCNLNKKILNELVERHSIRKFFENDDVIGCIEAVRIFSASRIKFDRVMNKLIDICSNTDINLYCLSHLVWVDVNQDTSQLQNCEDVEETSDDVIELSGLFNDSEDNNNNDYLMCDIALLKSNNPCAEIIVHGEDDNILSDEDFKLVSQNPWLILNDEKVINKIVQRVGNSTYDLIMKNQIDEACTYYSSAFNRQKIYGVFVLHCNNSELDYNLVFENNNRAISFFFKKDNELLGNKCIWNILFLYVLANYHPYWKQYSKLIHDEIVNILPKLNTFITLSPLLYPVIIDSLDAVFWYIIKVSHRAFPNSVNNVLRNVEESERLIDIYEFIYPDCDVNDIRFRVKVWNVWKYLVRNRASNRLRLEVISQYQNHEIIDGNIIFFSGKSRKQSIDLKPLHTQNLYNYLLTKPDASIFEEIPFGELDEGDVIPVEGVNDSVGKVQHVKICLTTCRPLYACPVSKTVWKDCAEKFDVKKESFFQAFVRFCVKHYRYPVSVEEFLISHSNQYNFSNEAEDCVVYGKDIKNCFRAVMERFSNVMRTYKPNYFVWTYNQNCKIKKRIDNEKDCSCGSH